MVTTGREFEIKDRNELKKSFECDSEFRLLIYHILLVRCVFYHSLLSLLSSPIKIKSYPISKSEKNWKQNKNSIVHFNLFIIFSAFRLISLVSFVFMLFRHLRCFHTSLHSFYLLLIFGLFIVPTFSDEKNKKAVFFSRDFRLTNEQLQLWTKSTVQKTK